VTAGAHNVLMDLEELEEVELERIRRVYMHLAAEARRGADLGRDDVGIPKIADLAGRITPTAATKET
jgi:hypothetical protein